MDHSLFRRRNLLQTRRGFLGRAACGVGSLALAGLLQGRAGAIDRRTGILAQPHYPIKAKRVIWLYMAGGMSHLETWDPKPKLAELHGQPMPESITAGQQIAQLQGQTLNCFAPQHPFQRYGESGQEISTIFPRIGETIADDICILRSMHTDAINHDPAHTLMNTGSMISGRPSMGSWLLYGLGNEIDNLPGYVVMVSTGKYGQSQPIAARQWHSGFLPSEFQGVQFRGQGDPVMYVKSPQGVTPDRQRDVVEAVEALNAIEAEAVDDPEIAARISQYELAFQMQTSVPDLVNFSDEPAHIRELYGTEGGDGTFASNCLLARRLAERGVKFIQLYHRDWDHHGAIKDHVAGTAAEVDRGVAALVSDLKQRGMLDDTLIVFGSEFGRTPMAQGNGRDHHLAGFSMWLAGGGIKPGIHFGATDELGYHAVENRVHINDLHATMLYLLGIDHTKLTYRFQGRDFRLTDVGGSVVQDILA
ncbi:DUF1501 domain-containing protein [Tautonia marina]|uniref:DUF1501 domain-containing protein n=1 Tax=Tautonia marina TaxID=2653855 RepID=UPI00126073B8|nr:DUF1501 domain-containing protein [Tautonia marina]